jgi:aryl-alcohol dehydrogenase-like predicted oxidoreductase
MLVRGIEADVLPVCRSHGMGVIAWSPLAGGWLSGRADVTKPGSNRAERIPARFDMTIPANQAKLEAAGKLAEVARDAGMDPIHLALGFVVNHPAVTAAIIGSRTMEQLESQLGAADVDLDAAVLDRIDAIVPPGTNLNPADAGYTPPSLTDVSQRRR